MNMIKMWYMYEILKELIRDYTKIELNNLNFCKEVSMGELVF